jgi:hypothetical protein
MTLGEKGQQMVNRASTILRELRTFMFFPYFKLPHCNSPI